LIPLRPRGSEAFVVSLRQPLEPELAKVLDVELRDGFFQGGTLFVAVALGN
jgi:hypothetical protein